MQRLCRVSHQDEETVPGCPRKKAAAMKLAPLALLAAPATAKLWLGVPPMGWEDFDSHTDAGYNSPGY